MAATPEVSQNVRVEPAQLALLWQLAARARQAQNEQELAFIIVNETLSLAPYRQAAWWHGPVPGAVATVSGLPHSDPGAPYVQWLGALCRWLARSTVKVGLHGKPPDTLRESIHDSNKHSGLRTFGAADLLADQANVGAEWGSWWPAYGLWAPLFDRTGQLLGGIVFARDSAWTSTELALLAELSQAWAHALVALNPRAPWTARLHAWFKPGRNLRRALIALGVVCLLPVPLSVLAPAEVTAKDPFVVRAPLDGVIERFYVQPNQRVVPGTPLLSLDATTLQSHYAVARKDYDTAQEEYRQTAQLAVTDDKDRLDMTLRRGKLDDSAVELDYSAQQLARVHVTAARAGIAVFADANDWNGKAVAVGEKILLLADPANVDLTADLPVADNVDVKPGGTLTLYPKSSPLSSYNARIDTVAYRAEPTPDGVLAYRIKASFVGGARPALGAMGTARIHGRWVPMAYYVLRRPLTLARQWLGW